MFTIKAIGKLGQVFKEKNYSSLPSMKQRRAIRDRWDNDYGAYLSFKLFHNGQELSWFTVSISSTSPASNNEGK